MQTSLIKSLKWNEKTSIGTLRLFSILLCPRSWTLISTWVTYIGFVGKTSFWWREIHDSFWGPWTLRGTLGPYHGIGCIDGVWWHQWHAEKSDFSGSSWKQICLETLRSIWCYYYNFTCFWHVLLPFERGFSLSCFSTGWLFPRLKRAPFLVISWFEVLRVVGFSGLLPWSCWSFLLQKDPRKSSLCWTGFVWEFKKDGGKNVVSSIFCSFRHCQVTSLLEWFWHRDFEQLCFWSKILDDAHVIRSVFFQLCHREPRLVLFAPPGGLPDNIWRWKYDRPMHVPWLWKESTSFYHKKNAHLFWGFPTENI